MSEASYDVLLDPYHCITDEPLAPEESISYRPSQRKMRVKKSSKESFDAELPNI